MCWPSLPQPAVRSPRSNSTPRATHPACCLPTLRYSAQTWQISLRNQKKKRSTPTIFSHSNTFNRFTRVILGRIYEHIHLHAEVTCKRRILHTACTLGTSTRAVKRTQSWTDETESRWPCSRSHMRLAVSPMLSFLS